MMNKIEALIHELCPNGVEYKALDDIFLLKNGYTPSKSNASYWENGTFPWFRMEDIRTNGRILADSLQHISVHALKGNKSFKANTFIVATSATIGEHALITTDFLSNQRFTNLEIKREYKDKFNVYFVFYYLYVLDEWCKKNVNNGGFTSVDMVKFRKFLFPIPPLPIQQEIVKILDSYSKRCSRIKRETTSRIGSPCTTIRILSQPIAFFR